jgi:MFS family permease
VKLRLGAACLLAGAIGWNTVDTGAIAQPLAVSYGVSLAVVGLFTTALFVAHLLVQVPGGRAVDRFGGRAMGLLGVSVIVVFNALALTASSPAIAIAARAFIGLGTGLAFIAGSVYVRRIGGSPLAQGIYGGWGLAGAGVAIAAVPFVRGWIGWRAPYVSAIAVGFVALVALLTAPTDFPSRSADGWPLRSGFWRDLGLYRLAAMYASSLGLSVVVANWVSLLLHRRLGLSEPRAAIIGALTLLLGVVTRPLGGWLLRERSSWIRPAMAFSLGAGGVGTLLLVTANSVLLAAVGAVCVGVGGGMPFASAFTGAAMTRPDAPGAAVGFVNAAANIVVIIAAPLLGLAFRLPGSGAIGFAIVASFWFLALGVLPRTHELGVPKAQL